MESGEGQNQPESTAEAGAHSGGGTRGGGAGGRARRLRPYPDHLGPSVALFPRVRGSRPFLGLFWLAPDGEAMLEPLGERAGAPAGGAGGACNECSGANLDCMRALVCCRLLSRADVSGRTHAAGANALVILACSAGQGGRAGPQGNRKVWPSCTLIRCHIFPEMGGHGRCAGRGMMRFPCTAVALPCFTATAWPCRWASLHSAFTHTCAGSVDVGTGKSGCPGTTFGVGSGTKIGVPCAAGTWCGGDKTACRGRL